MALDFSLLGNGPQFGNVLAAFQQGQTAGKARATENALATYATNPEEGIMALRKVDPVLSMKLEDDYARRKTAADTKDVFRQTDPNKRRDAATATGDPEIIQAVMKMGEAERADAKAKAEAFGKTFFKLTTIPPAERAAQAEQIIPALKAAGMPDEEIEAAKQSGWSDAYLGAQIGQARDLDDMINQANKDREFEAGRKDADRTYGLSVDKFGEDKRSNRVREGIDSARLGLEGQRVAIARQEAGNKAAGVLAPGAARKVETDLRKEFDGLPEVKNYRTVAQSAQQVRQLASQPPSPQGDIALIYSVMKAYDPTSVVRETEFATAQNASSVPDQVRNSWNKALKGQRLNPRQRQEMAAAVESVAKSAGQRYNSIEGQYRNYAQEYGANPDRVAPKAPAPAPPAKTSATRPSLGSIFGR